MREVIKGQQEPEREVSGSASARNREVSDGGPLHDSISPTTTSHCPPSAAQQRASSSLSLPDGGSLDSDAVGATEGTVAAGGAAESMGPLFGAPSNSEAATPNVSTKMAALEEVKGSGPADNGQPVISGGVQEGRDDRPRDRSVQEQPQGPGQAGKNFSIDARGGTRGVDAAGGEEESGPDPSGTSSTSGHGISEAEGLAPRLKLGLPWDDEVGPRLSKTPELEGGTKKNPFAVAATGEDASVRTIGVVGSAAAGLTYPGPRPLSAPAMRPIINAGKLNATSPMLSGRRFEGTTAGRDGDFSNSRSLGRTAGASLAGRLISYATRPGGTFDVFAAARDGQVSGAQTMSISIRA